MTPSTANADAVRSIVEEVLRRIRAEAAAKAISNAAPRAAPAPTAGSPALPDRVISLGLVEKLPAGTARIVVHEKAVVTPSARDRAKERGIAIERSAAQAAAAGAVRPFVVAHADAAADAAARTAEIARAVPRSQHLPATGLADVLHAIATHASRDAARAVLLTGRPAAAVVLANRSASLRAVTGRDAAAILAAAAECGANMLVMNPKDLPTSAMNRLCVEFASREFAVPADLAVAPAGCGCKH